MPPTERGHRLDGDRRLLQVSDVLRAVEDQFRIAFPRRVWVVGTVAALSPADAGGQSFLLTETVGEVDEPSELRTLPCRLEHAARADIDDTLRRLHDVAVDDLLVDGYLARVGGLLSYDTDQHTIVFTVTALDPQPTAAWLAELREDVRQAARAARLAERQRDIQVPLAPMSIALVGPAEDNGVAQARTALDAAGYALRITERTPALTGERAAQAPAALAAALRKATGEADVVLLVRQAGRPLALAPFDSEPVLRAVATSPVPVLTGLGADDDAAAVAEIAHQACADAEEAALAVLRRLARAEQLLETSVARVRETSDAALRRAARQVEQLRAQVAEEVRLGKERASAARARLRLQLRLGAAVFAAAVIAVAVVTGIWPVLAGLVLALLVAVQADRLWPHRRREPVHVDGLTFAAALDRLGAITQQLQDVTDPDEVLRLEADAAALADHCRALLRRPRPLANHSGAATEPTASADEPATIVLPDDAERAQPAATQTAPETGQTSAQETPATR